MFDMFNCTAPRCSVILSWFQWGTVTSCGLRGRTIAARPQSSVLLNSRNSPTRDFLKGRIILWDPGPCAILPKVPFPCRKGLICVWSLCFMFALCMMLHHVAPDYLNYFPLVLIIFVFLLYLFILVWHVRYKVIRMGFRLSLGSKVLPSFLWDLIALLSTWVSTTDWD